MMDVMPQADADPIRRDWPLVGRDEELEYVARVRREGTAAVVVGGAPGVGRSRLAAEAAAAARAERWTGERIDGATATASIPFGAVAHLAPEGFSGHDDPLGLLLAVTEHMRARAARRPLMIVVDDAHLLDEASLAAVRRLVGLPSLFLLLTVRSDVPAPAPILNLWLDGHAPRLELQALSRAETYHLVAHAGDGAPTPEGPEKQRWLWDHSLGNPLFLRELMNAGPDGAGWVPDRRAAPGSRLAALVRHRLGELTDGERTVLEVLAVGGPLPSTAVEHLAPGRAVASLVARGLVNEHDDGADPTLSLAHPVYDVVLRDRMTAGHTRALRRRLLEVLTAAVDIGPRAAVRIATLRLDQGVDVDAAQLVVAARYAQAAFPQALAERLPADADPVDDLTSGVASPSTRPSTHDLAVAERLARAAWDADRSLTAGLSLTTVLVARGRGADAASLTDELGARATTAEERVQVALARAALDFWVLGRAGAATGILDAAEGEAGDAAALGRLRRLRAGIALNVGRVHDAAALAASLADAGDEPTPLAAMAAATGAAALALGGRPDEAIALTERFLPLVLSHADEIPEVVGQLMLGRFFAARVLGRLDEAEQIAYLCYQPAAEQGSLSGMAVFTAALGQIALDRGQPAAAARRLREADVLLAEYDSYGYRPWVLASLAMAHALSGDVESARSARDLMRAATTQPRYFDADLDLADAWCHAADGAIAEAVGAASRAAESARAGGLAPFEAEALHALVRFGRPAGAADRLAELATATGSPVTERYARHAEAARTDDAAALDKVSLAFEDGGALLVAAEAAAQAGGAHHRAGSSSRARRSAGRAQTLVQVCRGAASPALRSSTGVPSLTAREHEVAVLVARGMTSRAIADRLVVSPRTVESHLYRIFAKLGISDRAELADVL
jgi:DNA-binding CsgD family transcriptional regulator